MTNKRTPDQPFERMPVMEMAAEQMGITLQEALNMSISMHIQYSMRPGAVPNPAVLVQ